MSDESQKMPQRANAAAASLSWWSWRPGIKPHNALLIGIPLLFVAFFFLLSGVYSTLSAISDSQAQPTRVTGVVTGYTTNILDSLPHITIRLTHTATTSTIAPAVTSSIQHIIHAGDEVTLDYSPHLHSLYALEAHGQRFNLPGSSPLGNLFSSLALLLLGLVCFPYLLLLTLWGWHDLQQPGVTGHGRVVGMRAAQRASVMRKSNPGFTPRIRRPWYRVALEILETGDRHTHLTFSVNEEQYRTIREGQMAQITYSPHLHHVYAIKPVETH